MNFFELFLFTFLDHPSFDGIGWNELFLSQDRDGETEEMRNAALRAVERIQRWNFQFFGGFAILVDFEFLKIHQLAGKHPNTGYIYE